MRLKPIMDAMYHLYSAYKNIMTELKQVGSDTDGVTADPERGEGSPPEEQHSEDLPAEDEPRPPIQGQEDEEEEQEEGGAEGEDEEEEKYLDNSWDDDKEDEAPLEIEELKDDERTAEEELFEEVCGFGWRGEPEGAAASPEESPPAAVYEEPSTSYYERRQSIPHSISEIFDPPEAEVCGPVVAAMWANTNNNASPPPVDVQSRISYESVQLPGSILDDNDRLPEHGPLKAKYDKMNEPFKVQKASDVKQVRKTVETLYFRDNKRRIDFVLAYKEEEDEQEKIDKRRVFEQNLRAEGLELETEDKSQSQNGQTYFVKIHAPWDLLVRYAEIMKLKKPIKRFIVIREGEVWKDESEMKKRDVYSFLGIKDPFMYDEQLIPKEATYFSTGFARSRVEQFIIKDRESFFTPSQRSQIVWEILLRVRYTDHELGTGISRLLSDDTYDAAFPLHDGRYDKDSPDGSYCDRRLLYLEWARPACWYKKQPLHVIRRYFGDKMAMYFAWLGFYTEMLIPAAILGGFTFICGLFVMYSNFNKPSEEICSNGNNTVGNLDMCPVCDQVCPFWKLSESCTNSYITFLFDNPFTVFFSIAMSFWATMFLELWKRKQAVIQWQWDLENYEEEEELRPQFHEKVTATRINPVTKKPEPYLPLCNQITRLIAANSLVLLMLLVVVAAVFAVTLYRITVAVAVFETSQNTLFRTNARLITSISAACINLMIILIMNFFYEKLVGWLTDLEVPRTETEYEDSFTLKMFLFQVINYYSSLIYIAFFKGRFFYHPGDQDARTNAFTNVRSDMCDPAGCLFELFVQLAIIMVGKQFFNNVMEIFYPIAKVWWNKRTDHDNEMSEAYTRWEQDYDLEPFTRLSLFNEYLEMVIQYGFVTLFVAAFPLAPIFALLNNIAEIRLDAYKYLTKSRRPRAERIQDIGIWFGILKGLTYLAVITNAFVISYTSDFIPRLVYMFDISNDNSLVGYVRNTLSEFNTTQYGEGMGPKNQAREDWPDLCYYRAYRNGIEAEEPYTFTVQFWHVATARLSFIIIFEHFVFFCTGCVAMAIPDIPVEVRNQMKREKKVEKETLFENEMRKIREERQGHQPIPSPEDDLHVDLGEGLDSRPVSRILSASSVPTYLKNHHL